MSVIRGRLLFRGVRLDGFRSINVVRFFVGVFTSSVVVCKIFMVVITFFIMQTLLSLLPLILMRSVC